MCVGFIAVTKKGQDLTRPGEKDDLMEVFHKQREDYMQGASRPSRKPRKRMHGGARRPRPDVEPLGLAGPHLYVGDPCRLMPA